MFWALEAATRTDRLGGPDVQQRPAARQSPIMASQLADRLPAPVKSYEIFSDAPAAAAPARS